MPINGKDEVAGSTPAVGSTFLPQRHRSAVSRYRGCAWGWLGDSIRRARRLAVLARRRFLSVRGACSA
jgi:hypothetical protein